MRLVFTLFALTFASACNTVSMLPPVTVATAPLNLRALRWAIVDESVTPKSEYAKKWIEDLVVETRSGALEAGLSVIEAQAQPDARIVIKAEQIGVFGAASIDPDAVGRNFVLRGVVMRGDRVVEQVIMRGEEVINLPGNHYLSVKAFRPLARELVNRLVTSPRVAALEAGARPEPIATRGAPPSSSPPPPVAATVPPVNASLVQGAPQRNTFALVVGIEKYRDVPAAATGARADAEGFARVAERTLGVPAVNIRVAVDEHATKTDIEKHVAWLKDNVPSGARLLFFFSGHGAPHAPTETAYLVPYDGDPRSVERTAMSLATLLAALSETKAQEIVVFVDSCFSGSGGRSVMAPGTRPLVRVKKVEVTAKVALLTAATAAEISGPAANGQNGVFTRWVLEGLGSAKADMDGDGQITVRELADWVRPRVAREAKREGRDQTPTIELGGSVATGDVVLAAGVGAPDAR